jgi:hypothetical protein
MTASDVLRQAEQALLSIDVELQVSLYFEEFLFEDTPSGDLITDRGELRGFMIGCSPCPMSPFRM